MERYSIRIDSTQLLWNPLASLGCEVPCVL